MSSRPVIGVFPFLNRDGTPHHMQQDYLDAVGQSGGRAELLTLSTEPADWEAIFARCDGLLFTGGFDLATSLYGQAPVEKAGPGEPVRDPMELHMMRMAHERDFPVFGICRGLQMMNVALGGTLWQDIPSQRSGSIPHEHFDTVGPAFHEVSLSPFLREVMGVARCEVNSYHHQGLDQLAPGVEVIATAPDGLVEGLRVPGKRCFFGVQWHPEVDFRSSEPSRRLFAYFIGKC